MSATWKNLEKFANEGLRTLLLAERVIPNEEFKEWAAKYNVRHYISNLVKLNRKPPLL